MHGLLEHSAQVLGSYACQLRKHSHGEILAVIIVNVVQNRREQAASVLALFRGFGSVVKFKYILIYQPGTDVIAVYLIRFLLNKHLIVKAAQTFGAFGTDNAGLCHFQIFEQSIAESQIGREAYGGVYCHNDMDMLVVGMHGCGDNAEVLGKVVGGCTDTEYKTHFALWSIMNSPLMIGCDVRKMSEAAKEILTNKDIIAINQDIECRGPYCIRQWNNPENVFSLIKPLSGGDYAVGMFNFSDKKSEMSLQFYDIGLPAASGRGLELYDCYSHSVIGTFSERYAAQIESHDCLMFRAKVVKL